MSNLATDPTLDISATTQFNFDDYIESIDFNIPPLTSTPRKATKRPKPSDSILDVTVSDAHSSVSADLQRLLDLVDETPNIAIEQNAVVTSIQNSRSTLRALRDSLRLTLDPTQAAVLYELLTAAVDKHNSLLRELRAKHKESLWRITLTNEKRFSDQAAQHNKELLQATSKISFLEKETELLKTNNQVELDKLRHDSVVYADQSKQYISNLEQQLTTLTNQIETLKTTHASVVAERDQYRHSYTTTYQESTNFESQLSDIYTIVDDYFDKNKIFHPKDTFPNTVQFLIDHLTNALKQNTDRIALKDKSNKNKTRSQNDKIDELKHEVTLREGTIAQLKTQITDLNNNVTSKEQEITNHISRIAEIHVTLQTKEIQLTDLTNNVASKEQDIANHLSRIAELQLILQAREGELTNKTSPNNELILLLQQKDTLISNQANQINHTNTTTNLALEEKDRTISSKNELYNTLHTQYIETSTQLRTAEQSLNSLSLNLEAKNLIIQSQTEQYHNLNTQFSETTSKLQSTEQSLTSLRNTLGEAEVKVRTLEEHIQRNATTIESLNNQIATFQSPSSELHQRLSTEIERTQQLTLTLNSAESRLVSLARELDYIKNNPPRDDSETFDIEMNTAMSDLLDMNKQAFSDMNAVATLQSIPHFSGDPNTLDVKKWLKLIERMTTLWSATDKMRHFPLKLTGTALKFHDKINHLEYDNWKQRLIERFHIPRSHAFYKNQFDTTIMKPTDRVLDFKERLESIFSKAFESDPSISTSDRSWKTRKNIMLKDRFMIGLKPEIKSNILYQIKEDSSYNDVTELASDVESALRYNTNLQSQDPVGTLVHKINSIETKMANLSVQHRSRSPSQSRPSSHSRHSSSSSHFRSNSRNSNGPQQRTFFNNSRFPNRNNNNFSPRNRHYSPHRQHSSFNHNNHSSSFNRNHRSPSFNRNNRPPTPGDKPNYPNKPPFRKGNCYNCGKPGHLARECRSKVSFKNNQ